MERERGMVWICWCSLLTRSPAWLGVSQENLKTDPSASWCWKESIHLFQWGLRSRFPFSTIYWTKLCFQFAPPTNNLWLQNITAQWYHNKIWISVENCGLRKIMFLAITESMTKHQMKYQKFFFFFYLSSDLSSYLPVKNASLSAFSCTKPLFPCLCVFCFLSLITWH